MASEFFFCVGLSAFMVPEVYGVEGHVRPNCADKHGIGECHEKARVVEISVYVGGQGWGQHSRSPNRRAPPKPVDITCSSPPAGLLESPRASLRV